MNWLRQTEREKGYDQLKRGMSNPEHMKVERAISNIQTDVNYRKVPMSGHPTAPLPYPQPENP